MDIGSKLRFRFMILGVDASTTGSGGGKRHLIEILKRFNESNNHFSTVRIWGVNSLLDQLPNAAYIEKFSHPFLNRGLFFRIFWQLFIRDRQFKNKFDILWSPFGTYSSKKFPYVSMSRNMLVFDLKEQNRFDFFSKIKFTLLRYKQENSFKNANGLIFLSKYAQEFICNEINLANKNMKIIHHGIGEDFKGKLKVQKSLSEYSIEKPYEFLYVSSIWPYKHHKNVVKSVSNLRKMGYPIILRIVGDNDHLISGEILKTSIGEEDPFSTFIFWKQGVALDEIANYYKKSDGFIFASTCENMPNILLEAMSSGMPILCSNYEPMPEFLRDGGLYFDPTNIDDLTLKLMQFLTNLKMRTELSELSINYSNFYNWSNCAKETYKFLFDNLKNKKSC